jgi:deoxyribonuclease IV
VRTIEGVDEMLERFDAEVGLEKLRSLHLNDSLQPLGSNRDRHAPVGKGEMGEDGCAAFLSAPAFENLPCILETPGDGDPPGGPAREQIELTEKLRRRGRKARGLS